MTRIEEAMQKLQRASVARGGAAVVRESDRPMARRQDAPAGVASANAEILNVSQAALEAAGYVVAPADRRLLHDQYRVIKRPLIGNALGKIGPPIPDANLIQVTSAVPGEGKTFTCLNLALSLAQEQDTFVLLVDADILNPQVSIALQVADRPGLLDFLADPTRSLESIVYRTSLPRLAVVPAGERREHAAELLASERMDVLVQEAVRAFPAQITLLDSPPIMVTSEARVLAESAGQIVVVVGAGSTQQDAVAQAVKSLPLQKPVSLILNRSKNRSARVAYGYGTDAPNKSVKVAP